MKITIITGVTSVVAAFLASPYLGELIEYLKNRPDKPLPSVTVPNAPPAFVANFVYKEGAVKRTEFDFEKNRFSEQEAEALLKVTRVAFGTGEVFQVTVQILNASSSPINLDVQPTYFSLADNLGRRASMISFCCSSAPGDVLASNEHREIQIFFQSSGWYGKSVAANTIYFRATGFLPVVRATWEMHTLATGA